MTRRRQKDKGKEGENDEMTVLKTVVGRREGVMGRQAMVREKEGLSDEQGNQREFE